MICLDKLGETYILATLNMREAQSKKPNNKYDDLPNYHVGVLVMIKSFEEIYLGCKICSHLQSSGLDRAKTTGGIRSHG